MLETLSDLIAHHAPAIMQGDAGIVILCAGVISMGYLWAYAQRKGAI